MVGRALAAKLDQFGHEVTVGARSAESESLKVFLGMGSVKTGSFADAARAAELVINATGGLNSLAALSQVGAGDLDGKPLLDVANMLEPQEGGPPKPVASVDNCLAVAIQQAYPAAKVVKSLNTMNCNVMVDPSLVEGDHVVFVSGDDDGAKAAVVGLLKEFGWRDEQILDLGGIESAAGAEMIMPLWLSVMFARGGFDAGPFNFAVNS